MFILYQLYSTVIDAWYGVYHDSAVDSRRGHQAPTSLPLKITKASIGAAARWDLAHPYNRYEKVGNWREPEVNWVEAWVTEWL